MARSSWKSDATSHAALRKLKFFSNYLVKCIRIRFVKRAAYFKKIKAYAIFTKQLVNFARVKILNLDRDAVALRSASQHIPQHISGVQLQIKHLTGWCGVLLKPRPRDTMLHAFTFFKLYLCLKGGYKRNIRSRINRNKSLRKKFTLNRYFSGRKFGEFIITRVCGGFRKNKDKSKIAKLNKDLEKARKRRLHQIKENARIWKRVLEESEKKGGKGKKGKQVSKKGAAAKKK